MTVDSRVCDLFIVGNSVLGFAGLRYGIMGQYRGCVRYHDGYFEIGALVEFDGKW